MGQGSFGRGTIKIGEEDLSAEELRITDSRLVPQGQSVEVRSMDVRFI
jgi:hypothetical protein